MRRAEIGPGFLVITTLCFCEAVHMWECTSAACMRKLSLQKGLILINKPSHNALIKMRLSAPGSVNSNSYLSVFMVGLSRISLKKLDSIALTGP